MDAISSLTMQKLLSIELPIKLTNSNQGRGYSWHKKAKDREDIENTLRSLSLAKTAPFTNVITLHLTRILGKGERLWDADSGLRGNAKELIDSLVAIGWFHDDSPKWIQEVRFFQDDTQRKNGSRILIEVFDNASPHPTV